MQELKLFDTLHAESECLENDIRAMATQEKPIRIVEAGCGRHWPLNLAGLQYEITGIDLDEAALSIRQKMHNDLQEYVIGDLRSVDLEKSSYDVVYSSFVLEHIQGAQSALDNFFSWLKLGGICILRIPDRNSVYGLITRLSPLWFHLFYAKYIAKRKGAGKLGHGPYPTYYDEVVSREGIHEYCQRNSIHILKEYGHPFYLNKGSGIVPALTRLMVKTISLFSLGTISWRHNNLTFVLQKAS